MTHWRVAVGGTTDTPILAMESLVAAIKEIEFWKTHCWVAISVHRPVMIPHETHSENMDQ